MGLNCSSLENLDKNEALIRLCGTDSISPNDPIWNTLLSHYILPQFNQTADCLLDLSVESLKEKLLANNGQTNNFSSLVKVFAARVIELKSSVQTADSLFLWQTYNAMFIIRNILKTFVSSLSDEHVLQQLVGVVRENGQINGRNLEELDAQEILMDALVNIIIDLPITKATYLLHLEAVNILIVFVSSQMFVSKPSAKLSAYRILMGYRQSAPLSAALMNNFIDQMDPPHPMSGRDEHGSFVVGMASGMWKMFKKNLFGEVDSELADLKEQSLASHSLYLLLILINHCPDADGENTGNPYREDFANFGNITASGEDAPPSPGQTYASFHVNYAKLYEIICDQINNDSTTLLLYTLVHRNISFKSYIMARSDIEQLVLPILHTLYNSPTSASRHIYMSLIVILILSEEDLFNQQVHDITVKNISWYTERNIPELSLGGLIILVVIRTIHYNILRSRDKYLHTNCLATLANMSSKFRGLHPYVAQRLISLFETLAKRQMKLSSRFHQNDPLDKDYDEAQTVQDLKVLEEVLRMILEIYNSTLVYQLPQNRHFVYSLLYKKDLFETFAKFPITQELVFNLDVVIVYFTKWLGGEDHGDLSVSEVMERVQEGILHWKPDILRKFPELKFKYVEEDKHEEFFIPYVWFVIFNKAGIYWSPGLLNLFDVATDLD